MASSNGEATAGRQSSGSETSFPRRFYTKASVERIDGGFALKLDGRPAQTPGRKPLVLPNLALAEAVAEEWTRVVDTINPRVMPLTRLANTSIDGVAGMQDEVLSEIVRFARSDLLVYRAAAPEELARAQRAAWDPVITWMGERYRTSFVLTEGITHVAQPTETIERVEAALRVLADKDAAAPFRLAAMHVVTTLTGSALLAMAVAANRIGSQQAWSAAHIDEDYQIAKWGKDEEASRRRQTRWTEMETAVSMLRLSARPE